MKKVLYLLSALLLPLVSFADLLPEPSDLEGKIDNEEGIVEEVINLEETDEEINEKNTEKEESELFEANVTASEKVDDVELHEIGDDGGLMRVSFGYCNESIDNLSETLSYAISQGTPFKVCFMMGNSANKDIKVEVRLVDLVNGLCSVNHQTVRQFISEDDLESLKEITIPAGNYIVKEFNILYPVGIEGDQGACTMFNIIKDDVSSATISAIVSRAYPMRFFVGTLDDVKNIINVENIELSLDDNKDLMMDFDVKNEGNLENLVELSGTVSNMFGYNKKFSIEGAHVLPGGLWHVTANLGSIPSYGGLFNIDFKAFATPYFSYDISKSSIDPSLIEMKTFDFSTTYFKMPWLIFAIIIIVILLIITMFRKPKQKVVYVQNPQQPIQPQQYQQQNIPQQQYPQQNIPQQNIPQQNVNQQQYQQPQQYQNPEQSQNPNM